MFQGLDSEIKAKLPEAGWELDALVAEKVMGWHPLTSDVPPNAWSTPLGVISWATSSYRSFQPSVDIAAAWQVVEKTGMHIFNRAFPYGARDNSKERWHAAFGMCDDFGCAASCANAETAPLAICIAALRRVGAVPPFPGASS